MLKQMNRRQFMEGFGAAAASLCLCPPTLRSTTTPPTAPVAVAKCSGYGSQVHATLARMFDQLGGLDRLVKGKTVAIKLNMTGYATDRVAGLPPGLAHWVHPDVIGATIRLLESTLSPSRSLEGFMREAGWNPSDFSSAASNVEFEDTNYAGPSGKYKR